MPISPTMGAKTWSVPTLPCSRKPSRLTHCGWQASSDNCASGQARCQSKPAHSLYTPPFRFFSELTSRLPRNRTQRSKGRRKQLWRKLSMHDAVESAFCVTAHTADRTLVVQKEASKLARKRIVEAGRLIVEEQKDE